MLSILKLLKENQIVYFHKNTKEKNKFPKKLTEKQEMNY